MKRRNREKVHPKRTKLTNSMSRSKRRKGAALERRKPHRSHRRIEKPPRTLKEYLERSRSFQTTWDLITQIPAKMRSENISATRAARDLNVSPSQVFRWARPAFRKLSSGKYVAKRTDRLLRVLVMPSNKGLIEIAVSDSREASLLGEYWNAVDRFLRTGDSSGLQQLRKKRITDAGGKKIRLLTNLEELNRQASAGVLRFESLYGKTV